MPFEKTQAASAPTRRSSRLRTEASPTSAAGTTAHISAAESAAVALAAVAPLSRRAARQQAAGDTVAETPLEPFIAATPEPIIADVPVVADTVEEFVEVPTASGDEVAAPSSESEEFVVDTDPTQELPLDDQADPFERASRAFRTGAVRTVAASARSSRAQESTTSDSEASAHVASRRPRNIRKVVTLGATVGVMSLAGLLAVSMTLPAEAVAAVQGGSTARTSLVSTAADEAGDAAAAEIQAFVAPAGVENDSLARADDFSTVSLVQVAAEQGINYSGEIFTNDPDAAIQWPFLVGVGMSYGYGMRSGRLHEGIDFVPGNGAPIQAIADGTVRIATEQGGAFGVTVYIDHVIDGEVITSHYSHMQYGSLQVKAGDKVTVGTVVGKTGNTGRSYGAHLHFELIVNGSTIDPMPWLKANAGRTSY
ncbi:MULTISPECIES: M23 family metallopeptidase [unclassified Microbacterium]|uniref:M23 family metallopeptidase n=1 Tax=unclassified Microbacterium TaxID=2609290 RepID=UPI001604CE3E|nr:MULTISPECIES: M23 family metallopeptidase [unclassified Microbacterium]QNA91954.1 M23 family metallopeptidase [Microbacterium sp. Se63.02b]QYM65183.1 M23 family metallopeptidase [Microbacterium sp. Se5.02b]